MNQLEKSRFEKALALKILSLLDLTDLKMQIDLASLCQRAVGPYGMVAAICVQIPYVHTAKEWFGDQFPVKVATVANFPSGDLNPTRTIREIERAIADGADEIDVVFPYQALFNQQAGLCLDFLTQVREASKGRVLKMILETGALKSFKHIRKAAELSIRAEADFLKTATGTYPEPVTLEHAAMLFRVIKELGARNTGVKISGGIRTFEEAIDYLDLAIAEMGQHWVTAEKFRFGSSSLYNALVDKIVEGA